MLHSFFNATRCPMRVAVGSGASRAFVAIILTVLEWISTMKMWSMGVGHLFLSCLWWFVCQNDSLTISKLGRIFQILVTKGEGWKTGNSATLPTCLGCQWGPRYWDIAIYYWEFHCLALSWTGWQAHIMGNHWDTLSHCPPANGNSGVSVCMDDLGTFCGSSTLELRILKLAYPHMPSQVWLIILSMGGTQAVHLCGDLPFCAAWRFSAIPSGSSRPLGTKILGLTDPARLMERRLSECHAILTQDQLFEHHVVFIV